MVGQCGVCVIVVDMGDVAQHFLVDDMGDVAVVDDNDMAVVVVYNMVVVLVVDGIGWWRAGGRRHCGCGVTWWLSSSLPSMWCDVAVIVVVVDVV